MIKAIIFDCFGVLIGDGLEAVVARQEEGDPAFRQFVHGVIGKSNRGETTPADSHVAISERLQVSPDELRQMIYAKEVRNDPLIKWVERLRTTHKTALLSNVGKDSLKHRFSEKELATLFNVVVVSAEVGMAKPDPEIYTHTAQLLDTPVEDCVCIDDRQVYVDGARRVGMQAILYQNFEQMKAELDKLLAADAEG